MTDPLDADVPSPTTLDGPGSPTTAVFEASAVVQLVAGRAGTPDAMVVELVPATVRVTPDRIVATDGDLEWSWLVDDIVDVVHADSGSWSILAVPGVEDHGVAVQPADVERFRASLSHVGPVRTAPRVHDDHPGPAAPTEDRDPSAAPTPDEVVPTPDLISGEVTVSRGWPTEAAARSSTGPAADLVAPPPPVPPDPSVGVATDPPAVPIPTASGGGAAAAGPTLEATDHLPPPPPTFVTLADLDETADVAGAAGATPDATAVGLLPPPPSPPLDPPTEQVAGLRGRVRRVRNRSHVGPATTEPSTLADLDARAISAWFGTHHVLDRVSLYMAPGQVTALIGPSGCGKSTFLRILNRMHEMIPSASLAGEVLLDGSDIYDPQRKLTDARRQIGMVFQKPNPFPAMSIYDNVVASYRLTGFKISKDEKDDVVESCLRKAGLWTEVRDRLRSPGGGLSGGQQQRLCIARALAIKPRVLLMDEPCSALDPTSTRRIEETIMELGSEVTIVIVTHNMQQAARVSDQCAFFLAEQGTPGVIVEHGPTEAMFHHPQDPRTYDYVNGRFG